MQKHLFQESADSMEEAILQYEQNGMECVKAVFDDIGRLLSLGFSDAELTEFVFRYSDYGIEGSGARTLDFIRKILRHETYEIL